MSLVVDRQRGEGRGSGQAGRDCEVGVGRARHAPGPCMRLGCHARPFLLPRRMGEALTSGVVDDLDELIIEGGAHEDEAGNIGVFIADCFT